MAAAFALSWYRPEEVAHKLRKRPGRAVSRYRSSDYDRLVKVAMHINSLDPEMCCDVEVITS
jgi:hypothetical protein